jgi:hypothetical protein
MDMGITSGNAFVIETNSPIVTELSLYLYLFTRSHLQQLIGQAQSTRTTSTASVWVHHPTLAFPFSIHPYTTEQDLFSLIYERMWLIGRSSRPINPPRRALRFSNIRPSSENTITIRTPPDVVSEFGLYLHLFSNKKARIQLLTKARATRTSPRDKVWALHKMLRLPFIIRPTTTESKLVFTLFKRMNNLAKNQRIRL